jgi:hypothetical protein
MGSVGGMRHRRPLPNQPAPLPGGQVVPRLQVGSANKQAVAEGLTVDGAHTLTQRATVRDETDPEGPSDKFGGARPQRAA